MSVRARLEALRDSIFFSGWWGNKLAGEVESMEQAYSIERANCDPADFLVPTTDQSGRTLAEPLDESGLRHTLRLCRERCVREVLELRKAIDSAFKAVRQAADLVNDPSAAPDQRWSMQVVRELQALRGAILVGHDQSCQPSALPMIRAGVPDALRRAVAPLVPRFDRVKSLMLELCDDASETGEDSNPTDPADSPAAPSESGCQSSLGPPAPRETATISTRAASGDGVVPTGGGSPALPGKESTPDAELRAALYTLAGNLDPSKPGSVGSVIHSHTEDRIKQIAANQRALNSPLGDGLLSSWPVPGVERPARTDRINAMLTFPCAVGLADNLRECIVRRVRETINSAVQAVDSGAGLRLERLTAGKLTAAELAASLIELRELIERWGDGLDKAEPFDAALPTRVFALARKAGTAATLLGRKSGFPQCDSVGSVGAGDTVPSPPAIDQTAIDRAAERGAERAVEKVARVYGGGDNSDAKPPALPAGAVAIDEHDAALLAFLNRNPSLRRKVSDVLPDKGPQDRKAIAKRLRKMADRTLPLVDYPKDGRSGVAILPAGIEALKRATAPTPR
ncbi:MAG: hypothetical protein IT432_04040 [Phycisphaerales bacterium]|nr:hypothetical protein [Phycisphaerales bacterium]